MSEPEQQPDKNERKTEDHNWGEHDRDYGRVRTGGDEPPPIPPDGGGP